MRANDISARIDAYVADFRAAMGEIPVAEREEMLQEIRSHIVERVQAEGEVTEYRLNQILGSVGDPRQLASQYKTEAMLRSATRSISPLVLLRATFRWATTGIVGVVALLIAVFGYGAAATCALCLLLKPLFPSRVGLWLSPQHTVTLGYWNGQITGTEIYGFAFRPPFNVVLGTLTSTNGPVREILGPWIYAVSLLGALLLLIGTTYFIRWFIRQVGPRRSRSSTVSKAAGLQSVPAPTR
jgi:uncharacterized membrane protein